MIFQLTGQGLGQLRHRVLPPPLPIYRLDYANEKTAGIACNECNCCSSLMDQHIDVTHTVRHGQTLSLPTRRLPKCGVRRRLLIGTVLQEHSVIT